MITSTILLLLRKDDMDPTARFILGIVLIIIVVIIGVREVKVGDIKPPLPNPD